MSYPLFISGLARSGTTLLARMLSAHRDVMIGSDPYLTYFRFFRNAIIRKAAVEYDYSSPFQDYYFSDDLLKIMSLVQKSSLDIPFDKNEWGALYDSVMSRASHECADLLPELSKLLGKTYKEILDNGLNIIAQVRQSQNRKWVGIKEVWVLEFFKPMALTYPEAHFIIIQRDPRAIMASMLKLGSEDTSQRGHSLSVLRHWRKYTAFRCYYQADPLFSNRLYCLNYEDLVSNPKKISKEICDFLDIKFDPDMIDASKYINYSTNAVWEGNSSFETTTQGISQKQKERWKSQLDPRVIKLTELACGPEMPLEGYEIANDINRLCSDPDILDYLIQNNTEECSWRSDRQNPQQDMELECSRLDLLKKERAELNKNDIRRSFLFQEALDKIKHTGT